MNQQTIFSLINFYNTIQEIFDFIYIFQAIHKTNWKQNVDAVQGGNLARWFTDALFTGNDLARCLRWGGGYEGESIPKLLEKLARADIVMMDRWNISIETKSDKEENLSIPLHKVLKVSELTHDSLRRKISSGILIQQTWFVCSYR